MNIKIPNEIISILEKFKNNGFSSFLVGGCLRDILLGIEPKDWDIATEAKPDQILSIFPDSIYENQFGTVGVKTNSENKSLKIVEITTFRLEGKYSDKRHPDKIKFTDKLEDDLKRRDFTINAMALAFSRRETKNQKLEAKNYKIIDLFNGQEDLKNKIIRAVGKAEDRFKEDALRMIRAIRLATELGFKIEEETFKSIKNNASLISLISKERVRDEFIKIINNQRAAEGVRLLKDSSILKYILPELWQCVGVTQNKHHIYTVFEHSVRALAYAVDKNFSLEIRLAALFHDIGKPATKRGEGPNSTFYGHEIVGAKMTKRILERYCFSKDVIDKVVHLVRYHLFYYNVGEVTEAGVRRFIKRVGLENIDDLIKLREADRIGSGVPKAKPYRIRHLLFMIEKVRKDPISAKMLKINGNDVMRITKVKAGPKVGQILSILLDEVLDNPDNNTKENLEKRAIDLSKLTDEDLAKMAEKAKQRKQEFEKGSEEEIKKKYWVK